MVAQFQSLMSPFIVLFTVPLAFTGGILGLIICGEQLSMLSLMGFALLMGTVVNNGIVFVDYVNQLRIGGMDRRSALIATGKTRMRPILMTALTTILAMFQLILSDDMAGQMGRGMSIVVVGGMIYATVMTLIIVPVIYDMLFKRNPRNVDVGSDDMDDIPDDAAEFIAEALALEAAKAAEAEITEVPIESPAE
jgi:multidrug efflux pump subunit AcrB